MGRKGKKVKAMPGTNGNPLFLSDTLLLKGDGCKVMAANGSVDANLRDSIGVDTTLVNCTNIEVNINEGGIVGGIYHNTDFAADGKTSSEVGDEAMAAGFVSTDTGVEAMAPGSENHASCKMVALGSENDALCEMVAAGSEIDSSVDMVASGSSSTDASCDNMMVAGSETQASEKGVAVGSAATDDPSRHPNLSDRKPGLRLNLNNIEVNIESGVNVHIGGVFYNSTFCAGGSSSGSNVVMPSGSASNYANLERMVTRPEVAALSRLLDVWNSGNHLSQSNIKVNVHSGAMVNIGCVYYNTNFVAGGKPPRPAVAASGSRDRHQGALQRSSDAAAAPTRSLGNGANAPGPSAKK